MVLTMQKTRLRSESDSAPSPSFIPSPLKVRRARERSRTLESTTSGLPKLYDDDYKKYIHDELRHGKDIKTPWTLTAPKSIWNPDNLSAKDARHCFYYAHYRLWLRRYTPRTGVFLKQFQDAASAVIDRPSIGTKGALCELTKTLNSKVILFKEPNLAEISGQNALKDLIVQRYLAYYGDYLSEECKRFRDGAIEKNEGEVGLFTGKNWTAVQKALEEEDGDYDEYVKRGRTGTFEYKTIQAIRISCRALEIDYEDTRYAIEWYAKRNDSMHCMVGVFIDNCDWESLATRLRHDLANLPRMFGDEEYKNMRRVLESIRDRYFTFLGKVHEQVIVNEKASQLTMDRDEKRRRKFQSEQNRILEQKEKYTQIREAKTYYDKGTQFTGLDTEASRRTGGANNSWQDEEEGLGLELLE